MVEQWRLDAHQEVRCPISVNSSNCFWRPPVSLGLTQKSNGKNDVNKGIVYMVYKFSPHPRYLPKLYHAGFPNILLLHPNNRGRTRCIRKRPSHVVCQKYYNTIPSVQVILQKMTLQESTVCNYLSLTTRTLRDNGSVNHRSPPKHNYKVIRSHDIHISCKFLLFYMMVYSQPKNCLSPYLILCYKRHKQSYRAACMDQLRINIIHKWSTKVTRTNILFLRPPWWKRNYIWGHIRRWSHFLQFSVTFISRWFQPEGIVGWN